MPSYGQNLSQNITLELQSKVDAGISSAQYNIRAMNYFQAQHDLETALELALELDSKKSIGLIHSKIGKLHYILEDPSEAKKSLIKAIDVQRLTKDNTNLAETYKTLADVYMSIGKYSKALDYYTSSQTHFNQEDLNSYEAEAILKKGQAHLALKDYNKSSNAFDEAIVIARRYQLNKILSSSLIYLGKVDGLKNNIEDGLKNASNGYAIAKKYNYGDVLNTGALTLSKLYEDDGNLKKSNTFLKHYITLSDSLTTAKRLQLSPERITTILSIALITILSLLTLSLYKNNNIRLKSNNVLHKKNGELIISKEKAELASKTKANFLSTVTHELRTPLYAVTGLTNMLLDEDPKPEQIQHLKSLKFSGDYLLTFINDILQINKIVMSSLH